jgi:hypothetical protein
MELLMKTHGRSILVTCIALFAAISPWVQVAWVSCADQNPVAVGASPVVSAGAPVVSQPIASHNNNRINDAQNRTLKISNTTPADVVVRFDEVKDGAVIKTSVIVKPNQSETIQCRVGCDIIYTSQDCVNCLLTGDTGGAAIIQPKK